MPEELVLPPARHEHKDVAFRSLAAGGMLLALALGIVLLSALWLFPHSLTDQYVVTPLPEFAPPRLQPSPRADMARFRQQQLEALTGTYWIDRDKGVVHLPIDVAMARVAAEGIPDWPTP